MSSSPEGQASVVVVDLPPPRVGKGDLLEGTLEPQRIPLAMLVESVVIDGQHGTAEISLRIGYGPGDRTKCSPGEGLVRWGLLGLGRGQPDFCFSSGPAGRLMATPRAPQVMLLVLKGLKLVELVSVISDQFVRCCSGTAAAWVFLRLRLLSGCMTFCFFGLDKWIMGPGS